MGGRVGERACHLQPVHQQECHVEHRRKSARQIEAMETAHCRALARLFVVQEGNTDLGLQNLGAPLIGKPHEQGRGAIMHPRSW